MLKNYMEDLVEQYLADILEESAEEYASVCQCSECLLKIKMEALNNLPPFYVTCKTGEVYGAYAGIKEQQRKANTVMMIARAIKTVSESTDHRVQTEQTSHSKQG